MNGAYGRIMARIYGALLTLALAILLVAVARVLWR